MNELTINPRENISHNLRKIMGYKPASIFSKETGINAQSIYGMLRGESATIENLIAISNTTGISLDILCKTKID